MSRPTLTVLTTPILPAGRRIYQGVRRALRPIVKPGAAPPTSVIYPGHFAVTRSVVEGLRSIGADYNYNPRTISGLSRFVYAPANEALLQAVALKRRGMIDFLVAGPVNALFPDEADGILLHPEIDLLIVASPWVLDLLSDAAELAEKSRVCPCGVDAEFWKPTGRARSVATVYHKSGSDGFCEAVEATVTRHGFEPVRVSAAAGEHRRFSQASFHDLLDRSAFAVFLSAFETQGIALAEAWSMDVPTLAWNPRGEAEWRGRRFRAGSSCPYLTDETGSDWRTLEELDRALEAVSRERDRIRPRRWVLDHMTDAICARRLRDLIADAARSATPAAVVAPPVESVAR